MNLWQPGKDVYDFSICGPRAFTISQNKIFATGATQLAADSESTH